MALTVYANAAQLGNWLQAPLPDNADSLLRSATFLIASAANRDPYNDTPTGNDVAVLADATCAQAALWISLGVDPAAGGLDVRVKTESKLGTGDVKFESVPVADLQGAVTAIAPQARQILYTGGLLALELPVWTGEDYLLTFGHDRDRLDFPPYGVPQPPFYGGLAEIPLS